MKPEASSGARHIDNKLVRFPDVLTALMGRYEQRVGYKCWKVPGRRENWLQWNDGGTPLTIRFDNSRARNGPGSCSRGLEHNRATLGISPHPSRMTTRGCRQGRTFGGALMKGYGNT